MWYSFVISVPKSQKLEVSGPASPDCLVSARLVSDPASKHKAKINGIWKKLTVSAWVHGCMGALIHRCMDECVHGCLSAWVHVCMSAWVQWYMGECIHTCMHTFLKAARCIMKLLLGKILGISMVRKCQSQDQGCKMEEQWTTVQLICRNGSVPAGRDYRSMGLIFIMSGRMLASYYKLQCN